MLAGVSKTGPGGPVTAFLEWTGGVTLLAGRSLREVFRPPWSWRAFVEQLDRLGVRSLPIVTLTALFTGMVLALQTAHALERYGTKQYVGQVVALSLVREMGPVLTALVLAGRVGAGITAELGTMAVTEQVDAIRALGASPIKKLVIPRLGAILLMMPLLVVLADGVGMAGGAVIAHFDVHQPLHVYTTYCFGSMELSDLLTGLGKSVGREHRDLDLGLLPHQVLLAAFLITTALAADTATGSATTDEAEAVRREEPPPEPRPALRRPAHRP
jgi:phospholipid/cholesterol/gamma-HCH transport system permease protein